MKEVESTVQPVPDYAVHPRQAPQAHRQLERRTVAPRIGRCIVSRHRRGPACDRRQQLRHVDRPGRMQIEAGGQVAATVFRLATAGDRDQQHGVAARLRADAFGHGVAACAGPADVDEAGDAPLESSNQKRCRPSSRELLIPLHEGQQRPIERDRRPDRCRGHTAGGRSCLSVRAIGEALAHVETGQAEGKVIVKLR
jgi:hypothetical protein